MDTNITLQGPVIVYSKADFDRLTETLMEQIHSLRERVEAAEGEPGAESAQLDANALAERVTALNRQLEELNGRLDDLDNRIDKADDQIREIEYKTDGMPDFQDFPEADDIITTDNLSEAVGEANVVFYDDLDEALNKRLNDRLNSFRERLVKVLMDAEYVS